ncbi:MAG TPA: thiamine pyrophosphate-requiring protein [Dehalococcoidia bacterium]|nr:thiamine pyrophosphate-requiring protein [Dehalococcoidia bacterium]
MQDTQTRVGDPAWGEYAAEEWSDALVASMKLGGIDNLFFVSGSELAFYQEAIAKATVRGRPAPRLVTMIHEHVALNAAMGNTLVTGRPAATAAHVDAGTFHYGAAIHTAWRGGFPVLITAGTGPRAYPGSMRGARDGTQQWLQEPRDQGEIVRQYTKMDHRLEHQDNPGLMVSRLLQLAMSEPRGPVYLSVPLETAMLPMPGVTSFPTLDQMGVARPSSPDPDDAKTIAGWLVKTENPVLFTSRAGHDPAAVDELVRLCELLAIPVTESTQSDRMNFPTTHPLYGTGPAAGDADVVLIMEDIVPYMPDAAPGPDAKIAWVSNDPVFSRLKTFEQRASLWLACSPSGAARAIYDAATAQLTTSDTSRIEARRERLVQRKQEMMARDEDLALEAASRSTPNGLLVSYELGKLLEPDTIVINDGLSNGGFVQTYAHRDRVNTYFRSGSSSGGWGAGAAFGIKLSTPERDVVLASGDGYFSFGTPMAALWAAKHHNAPFLSVVFVNRSYSTGTTGLRRAYPEGVAVQAGNYDGGTFDPPPDFAKLAEAAGGYGETVSATVDLAPALRRGLDLTRQGVPAVIAVEVPGPTRDL